MAQLCCLTSIFFYFSFVICLAVNKTDLVLPSPKYILIVFISTSQTHMSPNFILNLEKILILKEWHKLSTYRYRSKSIVWLKIYIEPQVDLLENHKKYMRIWKPSFRFQRYCDFKSDMIYEPIVIIFQWTLRLNFILWDWMIYCTRTSCFINLRMNE